MADIHARKKAELNDLTHSGERGKWYPRVEGKLGRNERRNKLARAVRGRMRLGIRCQGFRQMEGHRKDR